MIYYILGCFLIFYWRRFVYFIIFLFIKWVVIKWNIIKYKDVNKKETFRISDYIYNEYDIVKERKRYNFVVLGNDINTNLDNKLFDKDLYERNRNRIVHCNISDGDMNILFDLTYIFRKFYLYFDDVLNLDIFLEYVSKKYFYIDISNNDYHIVLYMNDNEFTERIYKLNNTLKFSDLFIK